MKTNLKRLKYYFGLGMTAAVVLSGLITVSAPAPQVSADHHPATGRWVDRETIEYNGQTFKVDTIVNGNYRYTSTTIAPYSCNTKRDFIEFASNPTVTGADSREGFYDDAIGARHTTTCEIDDDLRITLNDSHKSSLTSAQASCYGTRPDGIDDCLERAAAALCNSPTASAAQIERCMADQTSPTSGGLVFSNPPNEEDEEAEATDPELDCEVSPNPLTWIMCPVVKLINYVINGLDNAITSLLTVEQDKIFDQSTDSGKGYYAAWQAFRGIALGVLVIAALLMIIGQAIGLEILDAYTVKKVLPRLIVAIIGIALSWELMKWFVGLTNDLGLGIRQVIYYPFTQAGINGEREIIEGGESTIIFLLTAAAIKGLGIMGLLSFGATALLAIAIGFLVLIFRQLVIVILILFAPVAIACYVLPNTNGVWKLWYESFTKALMMFPIIMAFLAVGRVVAMTSSGPGATPVGQLIAFIAYIIPYFLIPLTFRFAGGALRTLGGFVNDKGRGAFDGLKKYRKRSWQEHGGRDVEKYRRRVMQKRADWADAAKGKASVQGSNRASSFVRRKAYGALAGGLGGYNVEAEMSRKRAEVSKELNDQINTGRDEEIRALSVNKQWALSQAEGSQWRVDQATGKRQFKTLGGAWVDEANVDQAYKRWGKDTFAQQTALSYEMRKATTEQELTNLRQNYHNVAQGAGGWKMSDTEAQGTWIGSSFENQNQHLEFKKTNWRDGEMSQPQMKDFVTEVYEKKGTYQLGQMSSHTIAALERAYDQGDADTRRMVTSISESFVSRFGGGAAGGDDEAQRVLATQQQQQQAALAAQASGILQVQQAPGAGRGRQQVAGQRRQAARQAGQGAQGAAAPLLGNVQTNTPGAAHVAERVRQLAELTGVYQSAPPGSRSTGPFPPIPPQN